MMEKLLGRGLQLAAAAQTLTVAAVAARLKEALPGTSVATSADQIVLRGKGLMKRWLTDPSLRFVGSVLR
jgi:hypothetical protein